MAPAPKPMDAHDAGSAHASKRQASRFRIFRLTGPKIPDSRFPDLHALSFQILTKLTESRLPDSRFPETWHLENLGHANLETLDT